MAAEALIEETMRGAERYANVGVQAHATLARLLLELQTGPLEESREGDR